jgi:hypothetical protein
MKIKKNGKVINLTESDLKRIVKKVLTEDNSHQDVVNNLDRDLKGKTFKIWKDKNESKLKDTFTYDTTKIYGGDRWNVNIIGSGEESDKIVLQLPMGKNCDRGISNGFRLKLDNAISHPKQMGNYFSDELEELIKQQYPSVCK